MIFIRKWVTFLFPFFNLSCVHLFTFNILLPGQRCWENRYQFYKRADEQSRGRAQYGGACDAIGTATKFSDPIGGIVTP